MKRFILRVFRNRRPKKAVVAITKNGGYVVYIKKDCNLMGPFHRPEELLANEKP